MAELYSRMFSRMPEAYASGGYQCTDEEIIRVQRGVVWELIKQMGQNLSHGHSIINITMPVTIFEPRSYLERIADSWCYAPLFLPKAVETTDPVERMKYVATFALAGLSNTCGMKKPFNPILGETYEARYTDGTEIFCEQSSHHPPVTNWQVIGPNKSFHLYGYGEWTASFGANSVKGVQKGTTVIEFRDGTKISYVLPEAWICGVIMGDRYMEYGGVFRFRDHKNKIGCDLIINPPQPTSFWGWGRKKYPTDFLLGEVFTVNGDDLEDPTAKRVISKAEGTWMGCLEFDGKSYWNWQEGHPKSSPIPVDDPLPSDCRYREDLIALASANLEESSKWKLELENRQRRDERMRKEGAAKRKSHS